MIWRAGCVDDLVHRAEERRRRGSCAPPDVEHVGAGRHRVDGLDVERLLAVPALLAAQVAVDLSSKPYWNGRSAGSGRTARARTAAGRGFVAYVLASSRIVGAAYASMMATVWPRPSMPLARPGGAVGALELRRRVAARRVRQDLLAVRLRVCVARLLAEVRRARRRVDERVGRRRPAAGAGPDALRRRLARGARQVVLRAGEGARLVEPGHRDDLVAHRGRNREIRARSVEQPALVGVAVHVRGEGGLGLRECPRRLDVVVVGRHVGDRQAGAAQEALDRGDVGVAGGEAVAEGVRAQELPVVRARRIGDPGEQRVRRVGVAQGQVDGDRDLLGVRRRAAITTGLGPLRNAARDRGAAGSAGRRRGGAERQRGSDQHGASTSVGMHWSGIPSRGAPTGSSPAYAPSANGGTLPYRERRGPGMKVSFYGATVMTAFISSGEPPAT